MATANAASQDLKKLTEAMNLLNYAGRFEETASLARRIDHMPRAYSKMGEYDGWVLNAEVRALDGLGRQSEADILFERLAALPWEKRDWMVNFAINRADRLVTAGRWTEALPAAELAVSVAAMHGSEYAKVAAAGSRVCAAHRLDPGRDLSAWWQEVDQGWKANLGSAVTTALCLGRDVDAKRYLNEGAKDPDNLANVLLLLQPPAISLYADTAMSVKTPYDLRKEDPEIEALLNQYGRELPKALWPVSGQR